MAFFDLRCRDCQKEFTEMVSFSKLSEVKCPDCGSTNHERVYKANIKGPISSGSGGGYAPPSRGFT
ncbi:FmdB family zinc ribbon protein [Calidifontibacillus oryziterrae]|uniref:FmdB family zinc ribbon protein n=1 Tax=Calidifontibacillus oryziterrae TaxID=1191699 RepID=UPI00030567A0|nr:zinc ribbon domain-containing protein [Calidifontibacillus oryziterrae]